MAYTFLGNSATMRDISSFQSVSSSNGHLELHHGNVHVTVYSPGRPLAVVFQGKQAFVNQKLVSKNTDCLNDKLTYQKTADGAIWYTNLPVGEKMTGMEIKQFNENIWRMREERERAQRLAMMKLEDANRARVEALQGVERARQAAMGQARRAMEVANRARVEALQGAERARQAAMGQARRAMEEANMSREIAFREAERTRRAAMEQARRGIEMTNSFWRRNW